MKTTSEAAIAYASIKSSSDVFIESHIKDFKAGIEFAQRWISVDDELPLEISTDKKDINGNGFTQYISYIVKGYFDSKGKPEAVKIAWFRPFVTKWDFRFDKKEYEPEFIITHWRLININ